MDARRESELVYVAGMLHLAATVYLQQRRPDMAARLGRVRALVLRASRARWYVEPERRTEPTGREVDEAADLVLGVLELPGIAADDVAREVIARVGKEMRAWARARQPRLEARRARADAAPAWEDEERS